MQSNAWEGMGHAARDRCARDGASRIDLQPCEDVLLFSHCWPHRGAATSTNLRLFVPFRCADALVTDTSPTRVVVAV